MVGTGTVEKCDQRTLVFYGTLLGLVLLDIILIFWILNPFTRTGAVFTPEAPSRAVSDARKPSPFNVAGGNVQVNKPANKAKKARQARATVPAFVDARLQ